MSRRSRGGALDPFGLSFLDLVSCAFAGVLILYLTADETLPEPERDPSEMTVIEVQAGGAVPAILGVRLRHDGGELASWEGAGGDGTTRWLVTPGRTTLIHHGAIGRAELDVIALELPAADAGQLLDVMAQRDAIRLSPPLKLKASTLYRGSRRLP